MEIKHFTTNKFINVVDGVTIEEWFKKDYPDKYDDITLTYWNMP